VKEETKMFIENLLEENPDKRMDMDEVLCHDFLKEEMAKKLPKLELI
jgi:serine/threonine protein kinase